MDSGPCRSIDRDRRRPTTTPRPVRPSGPDLAERLALLVRASARGDEQSFATLYDLTSARMYAIILRILRAACHAEEVTQELYLAVWRQSSQFDDKHGSVLSWMSTMAHHRAVDRVRSVSSDVLRDDREARKADRRDVDPVWSEVESRDHSGRVTAALGTLTATQREAITLTLMDGHTQVQAAVLLQVPLGTVKSRVRDGSIRLRNVLRDEAEHTRT